MIAVNLIQFPLRRMMPCPITGSASNPSLKLLAFPRVPSQQSQAPKEQASIPVETARPLLLESKALPLQWILDPEKEKSKTNRVLAALVRAEAHEPDVWLRDDIRQAFIAVSLAGQGDPQPVVTASYRMYGLHPDKVWPAIVARRKALLGNEYAKFEETRPNPKTDRTALGCAGLVDEEPNADGTSSPAPYEFPSAKKSIHSVRPESRRAA
jgi:hypothetical protein